MPQPEFIELERRFGGCILYKVLGDWVYGERSSTFIFEDNADDFPKLPQPLPPSRMVYLGTLKDYERYVSLRQELNL